MNEILNNMIRKSKNIVFFGGAGVSTESGIPDFRSADGLYNQQYKYPPEKILSYTFFTNHTEEFFDFYRKKMLFLSAKPNKAHEKLAELEKVGKLKAVVTQNIDNLHQAAGSETVIELHGSAHRNFCMDCGKFYSVEYIAESVGIPKCHCGGVIKPDVVLYQEPLEYKVIEKAAQFIMSADMLIIGGTSLVVYPAGHLVDYYRGDNLVIINKSKTAMDIQADLLINESIGKTLGEVEL